MAKLWGELYPYRCGVTPAEFMRWAVPDRERGLDPSLRREAGKPMKPPEMLQEFCGDCHPSYRRQAEIRGECIAAELAQMKESR